MNLERTAVAWLGILGFVALACGQTVQDAPHDAGPDVVPSSGYFCTYDGPVDAGTPDADECALGFSCGNSVQRGRAYRCCVPASPNTNGEFCNMHDTAAAIEAGASATVPR